MGRDFGKPIWQLDYVTEREMALLTRLILVPEFRVYGTMGILARGLADARLLDAKGVSRGATPREIRLTPDLPRREFRSFQSTTTTQIANDTLTVLVTPHVG